MAGRYDKYEPKGGGFRAPLAADTLASATPVAVGLNSSGRIVAGAGNSGIVGVMILTKDMKATQIVDIMTHGECVEMAGLTAGTKVTALTTTGAIGTAAADATHVTIGHTVEATRLIVRKSSVNV